MRYILTCFILVLFIGCGKDSEELPYCKITTPSDEIVMNPNEKDKFFPISTEKGIYEIRSIDPYNLEVEKVDNGMLVSSLGWDGGSIRISCESTNKYIQVNIRE